MSAFLWNLGKWFTSFPLALTKGTLSLLVVPISIPVNAGLQNPSGSQVPVTHSKVYATILAFLTPSPT